MDEVNLCYLLLCIVVALSPILFFLIGRRKADTARVQLPPGPYALPIIGNIFFPNAKKPVIYLAELAENLGPLFTLRFGSRLVAVASTPRAAREIFKTCDREFSGRFVPHIAEGLPGLDGTIALSRDCSERWRDLRFLCHTKMFSSQALESHSKLRMEKVAKMLDYLGSKDGEVVKITDAVFATVANTFTSIMVSQDIIQSWSKAGEMRRCIQKILELPIPGLSDLYPSLSALDFSTTRKRVKCMEMIKNLWGHIVSERRSKLQGINAQSRDFLDVLIENAFHDNEIYNLLTELLVASESLNTTIEWAMAELTRNPQVLKKLRDELAEAATGGIALSNESQLTKQPYLQACIKETLRLHPPNPFLVPRSALKTCKVMDYDIPKNCLVVVNEYALGRDPETWEDPLTFKPERFLIRKDLDVKGTNYELLPFGGGRRICAGMPLALKLMPLILASLVRALDWSFPSGIDPAQLDMNECFGVTTRKEIPLLLVPTKRNNLKIG